MRWRSVLLRHRLNSGKESIPRCRHPLLAPPIVLLPLRGVKILITSEMKPSALT